MQTNRIISIYNAAWMLVTFASFSLIACKEKESDEAKPQPELGVTASCMTLTESQLDDWFPKYWGNMTVIKFYPSYNPGTGSYDISVRGYNSVNKSVGNALNMNTGVSCGVNLGVVLGGQSYDVNVSDLNIINTTTGALVANFEKLILTPNDTLIGGINFLYFEVEARIGDDTQSRPPLLPCPPCNFCKPPCDTIVYHDTLKITKDTLQKTGQ